MKKLYGNIFVAGQLNPDDFEALSKAGIKTIINNRPDDEEPGQLSASRASKIAAQFGMSYHYLPMVNGQPLAPNLVEDFKAIIDASDEPLLAHCRSGMRSSFLWAMGQIPTGKVTVDQAINAAKEAGIPLENARVTLESVKK